MGIFGNEHLAQSVGYADGHANGLRVGKAAGYTEGWNAAVLDARQAIATRDQEIARLGGEVHKGNAKIWELVEYLEKAKRISKMYETARDDLARQLDAMNQRR